MSIPILFALQLLQQGPRPLPAREMSMKLKIKALFEMKEQDELPVPACLDPLQQLGPGSCKRERESSMSRRRRNRHPGSTYTTARPAAPDRQAGDFGNPTSCLRHCERARGAAHPAAHSRPAPTGERRLRLRAETVATNGIRR